MQKIQNAVFSSSRVLRWAVIAIVAVIGFQSTPARAQYTNPHTGTNWNNPTSSFLDTVLLNNRQMMQLQTTQMVNRNMLLRSLGRSGPKLSKKQKAQADRFAKYRGTMFKSGKPIMPAQLAASFVKKAGTERDDLQKVFGILLDVYNKRSKEQKAPANDLARTLAYCIAMNYAYYTEQEVSAAGLSMLRGKIRTALGTSDKFRKMKDKDKQKISETLIILTHFAALGYDKSKEAKDKELMKSFSKLAGLNLKGMLGVEPNKVKLEKTGLVVAR